MKRRIFWGLAVVSGLVASTFLAVQPAYAATGIRVVNGVFVEANGTPLKLRGINHPGTTSGGTATCTKVNEWPGGFQGQVTVTNTGTNPTTEWTVVVTFTNGQQMTRIGGGRTMLARTRTRSSTRPGTALGPNASTSFGFLGGWNGGSPVPTLSCTRTP